MASPSRGGDDQLVGNYRISHEIGKGSFAKVYKAIYIKSNRIVAIKSVMRAKLNRRLLENLESEISILTSLKHPHITRLKECIKSSRHIHLVMEYCSMGDVAGFIKNRDKFEMLPVTSEFAHLYPSPPGGGLNEVIVRHFLKQLASALSFLRAKQLIHRDLKPQNLLLTPTNYTPLPSDEESENWDKMVGITTLPVLKVADFGFARELQVSSLAETLCGSPLYMAPEILRYEKYDAKADLWSMGTVLYEMISGRPPFRATNHVDLLRKIEEGNDRINFPSRTVASDQLKDLIFGLLKRSPVHRMGFAQFFNHPAVQEDIPGVDPAYKVSRKIVPKEIPPTQAQRRESVVGEAGDTSTSRVAEQKDVGQYEMDYREKERNRDGPSAHELDNEIDLPFARPTRQGTSPPLARPSVEQRRVTIPQAKEQQSNSPSSRTPIHTHFPSTARQETNVQRPSNAAMERHYSSPPFQSHPISPHQRTDTKSRSDRDLPRGGIRDNRDSRERIDPDLVSEYVVIEKRSVEVNALADELAASPRVGIQTAASNASNAALARRSSSGRPPSRPSSSGKSMPPQARSLEKKYGASPGSAATSALARALTLAPFRIFGMGSPKYSPPPQPSSFPTYTPPGYGAVVMTNAAKIINLSEEDQAIVNTLESCASKGDVVYHFAAVKYSQLVPMAPGIPQGLSLLPPSEGEGPEASNSEFDLTPEAVVMLAEQALVLYVKCISLLNRAMQIAGKWWSRTNLEPNGAYHRSHAAEKINGTVQWIRQRFNEAMEKADYVRLKLKEAQGRLPTSHPSHPSNHFAIRPVDSKPGMTVEQDIFISPGITAERLMFDRAIEMSRGAAVNELVCEDLDGCHMSYATALKLVEAVLEVDDDEGNVDDDDRSYIENVVTNIKARIEAVNQKIALHSKRSSGIHSMPSSPAATYSPIQANTPPR